MESIRKCLREHDILDLLIEDYNLDEYNVEADMIYEKLANANVKLNDKEIEIIIHDVFFKMFSYETKDSLETSGIQIPNTDTQIYILSKKITEIYNNEIFNKEIETKK